MHKSSVRTKRSGLPVIIMSIIVSLALGIGGLLAFKYYDNEIDSLEFSKADPEVFFNRLSSTKPFINSAVNAKPYIPEYSRDDALYRFEAPEGFIILSHSSAWNDEKLIDLYHELKLNAHGEEIEKLSEIIVFGHDNEDINALATYSPGITSTVFYINFPAIPDDFTVEFPKIMGRINIYGGNTKTTIESIAGSLSHEYGHHYTFYYMFDYEMRVNDLLGMSNYAKLRQADRFNLIGRTSESPEYFLYRHLYLLETAAEDYVQLMGSPTTRQVMDYVDVKQLVDGAEQITDRSDARNAFPQENMMIPLAFEVPSLLDYYYSYIDVDTPEPLEERQDITLNIEKQSVQFNLAEGPRTFDHYIIKWNTPYTGAIYTLACYEPYNYSGWGRPIKTVRPGQNASAVIGEYAVAKSGRVYFMDDEIAQGYKMFYVVAQLPDGTYYMSDKLEYNFG